MKYRPKVTKYCSHLAILKENNFRMSNSSPAEVIPPWKSASRCRDAPNGEVYGKQCDQGGYWVTTQVSKEASAWKDSRGNQDKNHHKASAIHTKMGAEQEKRVQSMDDSPYKRHHYLNATSLVDVSMKN